MKSAVKTAESFSLRRVFLPIERSKFQCDSPRMVLRPLRPSALSRRGRKLPKAAAGSANRFRPDPPLAGLPVVPTPVAPPTLACSPVPEGRGLIGIAPAATEPTCGAPPQALVDSTTVS